MDEDKGPMKAHTSPSENQDHGLQHTEMLKEQTPALMSGKSSADLDENLTWDSVSIKTLVVD